LAYLTTNTITTSDPTTPRDEDEDGEDDEKEHPGTRRNETMVAVTNANNTNNNNNAGIRRQSRQGVVLDLTLRGDGFWNASVLPLSRPTPYSSRSYGHIPIIIAYTPLISP
jgi:hypothetical protein